MIDTSCTICYQIACRQCTWIASDEEVLLIQKGKMTACPWCGWKPGDAIRDTQQG